MEDIPVLFTWVYPKIRSDGSCIAYCFAYVRDPKNYSILYAGVKYNGQFSELSRLRCGLRRTALERLYKKPVYAVFSLGDDENYKKNLNDPQHKFNGLINNGVSKKSVSIGKFFVYCALNQAYSDLGISANKSNADFRFNYVNEKYEVLTLKMNSTKNTVHVKLGYDYRGDDMRRILMSNNLVDAILGLRKRSRFFGVGGDRKNFENLRELEDNYLRQFGVVQKLDEKKSYKCGDYVMDKKVIFYRVNLSNNTQAHISLMEYHDWLKFVEEVYGKNIDIKIPGFLFNTYCMGFTIKPVIRDNGKKKLYRKIAIDKMIDRPNIIDANLFDGMTVKDLRTWFGKRIGYFPECGMGRMDYNNRICLTSYYLNLIRYNENIRVYDFDNSRNFMEDLKNFLSRPFRYFSKLLYI